MSLQGLYDAVWPALQQATKVSEQFVDASFFRRNGNSAQVPDEIAMLRKAVLGELSPVSVHRPVRTVCEVGFNAGHSAIVCHREVHTRPSARDLCGTSCDHSAVAVPCVCRCGWKGWTPN